MSEAQMPRYLVRMIAPLGHSLTWDPFPDAGQPYCPHGDECARCQDIARWTCPCDMTVLIRGDVVAGRATGPERCQLAP